MTLGPTRNYVHFRPAFGDEKAAYLVWIDADGVPINAVGRYIGPYVGMYHGGPVFGVGGDLRLKLPFILKMYQVCVECWEGRPCTKARSIQIGVGASFAPRQPASKAPDNDPVSRAARLLGVTTSYTEKELNAAFREKAKTEHPDRKQGNEEAFKKLVEARDLLMRELKART